MIINNTRSHAQKNTQYGSQCSLFTTPSNVVIVSHQSEPFQLYTVCSKGVENNISDIKLIIVYSMHTYMCYLLNMLNHFTA